MRNSLLGWCKSRLLTAGLLAITGAAGLWLWQALGDSIQMLALGSALLVLATVMICWQARVRDASRLRNALNAYAEREIARQGGRRLLHTIAAPSSSQPPVPSATRILA